MTSISSKFLPFIVLAIACSFVSIDMFTDFTIDENHVTLLTTILTPLGMGGLINKGWNTYKNIKNTQFQKQLEMSKTG